MRILLYLFLALLTSCVSIQSKGGFTNDVHAKDSKENKGKATCYPLYIKPSIDTLYISIAENNIHIKKNTTVEVYITNATCSAVQYGDEHYFDYYDKNIWKRLSPKNDSSTLAWRMVGYELQPYMEEHRFYLLSNDRYDFKTGKYRIVVPVHYKDKDVFLSDVFYIVNDSVH